MENLNFKRLSGVRINDYLTQDNKSIFELVKEIPTEPGLGISLQMKLLRNLNLLKDLNTDGKKI